MSFLNRALIPLRHPAANVGFRRSADSRQVHAVYDKSATSWRLLGQTQKLIADSFDLSRRITRVTRETSSQLASDQLATSVQQVCNITHVQVSRKFSNQVRDWLQVVSVMECGPKSAIKHQ